MTHTLSPVETVEYPEGEVTPGVLFPDGTVHHSDGTIDHPDGTTEANGYFFDPVDWNELDPPEGSPEAEEIPHEIVMAEIAQEFGFNR